MSLSVLRAACAAISVALAPIALAPIALVAQRQSSDRMVPRMPQVDLVQYDVRDLPLVEMPPLGAGGPATGTLVVLITGDGDWADLVRSVADTLRRAGAGVVGLKARSYLQSKTRTPGTTAADVERIIRHYQPLWTTQRIAIVGYSRGADFAPFIANRLPADLRSHLALVSMFGLAPTASFEFHWSDLVRDAARPSDLPTAPELAQLRNVRLLCVYGDDEKSSGCKDGGPEHMQRVERSGGHHLGGDYTGLGALVLAALTRP